MQAHPLPEDAQRQAIVHIGTPKTGTTTVQHFLWHNRESLAEQGMRYHRVAPRHNPQPEYTISAFTRIDRPIENPRWARVFGTSDGPRCAEWLDSTQSALAEAPDVTSIVSSEFLYDALTDSDLIASLHSFLMEHFEEVAYLLYIRRQDTFLESGYSQHLRLGLAQTFEEYMAERSVPDYDARVLMWEEATGDAPVRVRIFERAALTGGDLLQDFCTEAGIEADGLERPDEVNQSLTARQAAFVLRANRALSFLPRHGLIARCLRRAYISASEPFRGSEKFRMTDDQRRRILDGAAASNERLRARLFPDRGSLFSMSDLKPAPATAAATAAATAMLSAPLLVEGLCRLAQVAASAAAA